MKNNTATAWLWTVLSVIWVGRGLNAVYGWLKHGFGLDYLNWSTGLRMVGLVVGVLLLVKYYPLLKTGTGNSSR